MRVMFAYQHVDVSAHDVQSAIWAANHYGGRPTLYADTGASHDFYYTIYLLASAGF